VNTIDEIGIVCNRSDRLVVGAKAMSRRFPLPWSVEEQEACSMLKEQRYGLAN